MESHGGHDRYLNAALERLQAGGFECTRDGGGFEAVATRSRFSAAKLGLSREVFLFKSFPSVVPGTIAAHLEESFQAGLEATKGGPPRGLGKAVTIYSVAMTSGVDDATAEAVRSEAPKKHWAAFVVPVVYDEQSNRIHYFEKTPVWGGAYYKGIRRTIEANLGPVSPDRSQSSPS